MMKKAEQNWPRVQMQETMNSRQAIAHFTVNLNSGLNEVSFEINMKGGAFIWLAFHFDSSSKGLDLCFHEV